MNEQMKKSQGV